jgi:hypothetical protein
MIPQRPCALAAKNPGFKLRLRSAEPVVIKIFYGVSISSDE